MDRAVAHSQEAILNSTNELGDRVRITTYLKDSTIGLGRWFRDIPFQVVPKLLIEQLFGHPFTYEEYLQRCPWLNGMENLWNAALVGKKDDRIIAFQYGHWDPLSKDMEMTRFTIVPGLFRIDGEFLRDCMLAGKEIAKLLGAKRLYWITCRWKAVSRKLPGEVRILDTRVMEVL